MECLAADRGAPLWRGSTSFTNTMAEWQMAVGHGHNGKRKNGQQLTDKEPTRIA
jgi:hypothetical protein